jgi:hypothetical protein
MWLEPPFNMLISAPTCSGKTEFIMELLYTHYKNVFVYIIIICPTFINNKAYDKKCIYKDDDIIIMVPNTEKINESIEYAYETYKNTKSLIIIDDCAFSKDVKSRVNILTKLGFSARHDNISVWVLTQQYTSIAKTFRENIGMLILYYTPSKNDVKEVIENYGMELSRDEVSDYIRQLKETPYSKLVFRLRQPYSIRLI